MSILPRRSARPSSAALAGLLLAPTMLVGCGGEPGPAPADLILRGGHVVTMDEERPRAEALAIAGDRIVYVGDEAGVEAYRGPETRVVDLDGATALPGLTDAHAHLMGCLLYTSPSPRD